MGPREFTPSALCVSGSSESCGGKGPRDGRRRRKEDEGRRRDSPSLTPNAELLQVRKGPASFPTHASSMNRGAQNRRKEERSPWHTQLAEEDESVHSRPSPRPSGEDRGTQIWEGRGRPELEQALAYSRGRRWLREAALPLAEPIPQSSPDPVVGDPLLRPQGHFCEAASPPDLRNPVFLPKSKAGCKEVFTPQRPG
jgi:hypothetical protein